MNPKSFALILLLSSVLLFPAVARAQAPAATQASEAPKEAPKSWYQKMSVRGYTQVRYNRLLETNRFLKCEQCDRSLGDNGSFFLRRVRLVFSGDVHERVYFYIQPDLASSAGTDQHFAQIRDAYFDLALDSAKEFRFRIGQSKVPFGWENLQSSSNRLAFDRDDALNSAVLNERDLGLAFYWAPADVRKRFKMLTDSGLKGSGDYGVFGLGFFNGQTANRTEANNNRMVVTRLTYPVELPSGQIFEMSAQAYAQLFSVSKAAGVGGANIQDDYRAALSAVWYPQPFGLQAEWNWGKGPSYDAGTNSIAQKDLKGGYVQAMYRASYGDAFVTPYVRAQYFDGGKKAETDARNHLIQETEGGVEWQPMSAFELTLAYMVSHRRTQESAAALRNNDQRGNVLRVQAQFNY